MRRATGPIVLVVVLIAVVAGGVWWMRMQTLPPPAPAAGGPVGPLSDSPQQTRGTIGAALPSQDAAIAAHVPEPRTDAPPLASDGLAHALASLLGHQTVERWLQLDDFPRRFVATVDNLDRAHAPSMAWPIDRTPGRFAVVEREGRTFIGPENAERYAPLVALATRVDAAAAAALYARMLPLLQQAYEALGYPRKRFHIRLLTVVDHLLAAPDLTEPVEVVLTKVKGPVPSERPWVRYEFADPALEAASAGHKILARVGRENAARLKDTLRQLRAELVRLGHR